MTNEEALKVVDTHDNDSPFWNCVREALEKQIAKKPERYTHIGITSYRCPVCKDSWNVNEYGSGMECCWTCGQKIDWSEVE